ncbi:hypothetical protein BDD12DRAFT_816034 [Trichophaea hybrida]|nr:hypothetical protein BDD12DRAFT_816034 [Trichophaea hybrida]
MSFLNLIAVLGEPQFPAVYLVQLYTHPLVNLHGTVGTVLPVQPPEQTHLFDIFTCTYTTEPLHYIHDIERDITPNVQQTVHHNPEQGEQATQQSTEQHLHSLERVDARSSISSVLSSTSWAPSSTSSVHKNLVLSELLVSILVCVFFGLPFVVIYFISGFEKGESTTSQRVWIMLWIVSGQVSAFLFILYDNYLNNQRLPPGMYFCLRLFALSVLSVASIGGLVTVIKIILHIGICEKG